MRVIIGTALIAPGLIVDWPPRTDLPLPENKSFIQFLCGVVGVAELVLGLRQEK
jgi:hypothetical protein